MLIQKIKKVNDLLIRTNFETVLATNWTRLRLLFASYSTKTPTRTKIRTERKKVLNLLIRKKFKTAFTKSRSQNWLIIFQTCIPYNIRKIYKAHILHAFPFPAIMGVQTLSNRLVIGQNPSKISFFPFVIRELVFIFSIRVRVSYVFISRARTAGAATKLATRTLIV